MSKNIGIGTIVIQNLSSDFSITSSMLISCHHPQSGGSPNKCWRLSWPRHRATSCRDIWILRDSGFARILIKRYSRVLRSRWKWDTCNAASIHRSMISWMIPFCIKAISSWGGLQSTDDKTLIFQKRWLYNPRCISMESVLTCLVE